MLTPPAEMKWTYEIGETCWIFCGAETDDGSTLMSQGVILGHFQPGNHPNLFYIIQILDPDFLHFEVRDALLMSPTPDAGPLYQRMRVGSSGVAQSPLAIGGDNTPVWPGRHGFGGRKVTS